MEITEKRFEKAVGEKPTHDDLERCNCKEAGKVGHWDCGWSFEFEKPNFMVNRAHLKN